MTDFFYLLGRLSDSKIFNFAANSIFNSVNMQKKLARAFKIFGVYLRIRTLQSLFALVLER